VSQIADSEVGKKLGSVWKRPDYFGSAWKIFPEFLSGSYILYLAFNLSPILGDKLMCPKVAGAKLLKKIGSVRKRLEASGSVRIILEARGRFFRNFYQ